MYLESWLLKAICIAAPVSLEREVNSEMVWREIGGWEPRPRWSRKLVAHPFGSSTPAASSTVGKTSIWLTTLEILTPEVSRGHLTIKGICTISS
jgi:hypothetical protein